MSTPMSLIASGSFTSDGTATTITFPSKIDRFVVRNRSIWGSNPANLVVQSEWYRGYSDGQATTTTEAATGAISATLVASGGTGFTELDESVLSVGTLVATGTQINQANPAVVLDATTPSVGDIVRLANTTAMLQVAGLEFSVTAVTAGVSYTLGYLDSSGFAAAATNVDYHIVPSARYSPQRRWITGITKAASAVVTFSVTHKYLVGDIITVNLPDSNFGMTEINGLQGTITAISTANNTVTVDINSTGFTTFAFPSSATAAGGISFPNAVPVGELATQLTNPTENATNFGLILGASVVGSNTDVMDWVAYGSDVRN